VTQEPDARAEPIWVRFDVPGGFLGAWWTHRSNHLGDFSQKVGLHLAGQAPLILFLAHKLHAPAGGPSWLRSLDLITLIFARAASSEGGREEFASKVLLGVFWVAFSWCVRWLLPSFYYAGIAMLRKREAFTWNVSGDDVTVVRGQVVWRSRRRDAPGYKVSDEVLIQYFNLLPRGLPGRFATYRSLYCRAFLVRCEDGLVMVDEDEFLLAPCTDEERAGRWTAVSVGDHVEIAGSRARWDTSAAPAFDWGDVLPREELLPWKTDDPCFRLSGSAQRPLQVRRVKEPQPHHRPLVRGYRD